MVHFSHANEFSQKNVWQRANLLIFSLQIFAMAFHWFSIFQKLDEIIGKNFLSNFIKKIVVEIFQVIPNNNA